MSFRSRPVLDRKHRPRWQDELRTQQLTVIAFAVAIALAVGIFGAAAWSGYWDAHFRPVAAVAGSTYDRSDLDERQRILVAEASASITELQTQLGGPRDQFIQQQIDQISQQLASLDTAAADSLVESAVLASRADAFGVSVTDDELDAGIADRFALAELVNAQLVLVEALPEDAAADDEPTAEQFDAARKEAQAALDRLEGGEAFADVAADVSDDFTSSTGGVIGWFGADDPAYGEYFDAIVDSAVGDLVGPVETDRGYAVLQVLARREATTDSPLRELLSRQGVTDDAYRAYVRDALLVDAYRDYFSDEVVSSPTAQRRVAQIFIAAPTGAVVPQERARHVLINPLPPDAAEGDVATDEQWAAALTEADEVHDLLAADDADWFGVAEEHSDDTGSGARGGDLGWFDAAASPYVAEFTAALAGLEVGELSEPVRTEFGYHVIQKTGERLSPQAEAADLVEELRADPDTFAEVAARVSEDYATAAEGGELGWVAPYQLDEPLEEVVFGLDEVDQISEPYDGGTSGITIYKLEALSDSREIEADRLEEIRTSGFDRWLEQEVRAPVETWVDPEFASSTAA
ncbi:MAG: peptidyl-prolyl cis-trans isomerase SurA [Chloroflexota bacterium]|nr:peptidyl-prolyl cis-trans isomerase SurA [Chloroflexota bacterium]